MGKTFNCKVKVHCNDLTKMMMHVHDTVPVSGFEVEIYEKYK